MVRDDPFNAYSTKFAAKLIFLTPRDAHVRVRIRGYEILVFRKILLTHERNDRS